MTDKHKESISMLRGLRDTYKVGTQHWNALTYALSVLENCEEGKIAHILLTHNPIGTTAEGVEINMELARAIVKMLKGE